MLRFRIAIICLLAFAAPLYALAEEVPKQPSFEEVAEFVRKPKFPGDSIFTDELKGNPPPFQLQVESRLAGLFGYTGAMRDKKKWLNLISNADENIYARMCGASLLAGESAQAREFLEAQLGTTNLRHRYNAAEAVRRHINRDPKNEWGVNVLLKLIESGGLDEKEGTSSRQDRFLDQDKGDIMFPPIDSILWDLADMKCERAVPVLIGLLERAPATNGAAQALGEIGDPKAIPILMKILRDRSISGTDEITALGKLKAREAVPLLISLLSEQLDDLAFSGKTFSREPVICVMESLLAIGDKSAVLPIRTYLTSHPTSAAALVAKRVLAKLASDDPVADLLILLKKESGDYERGDLVDSLVDYPEDARVINVLASLAQTSGSAHIRTKAIDALGAINTRSSLIVLAELIDRTFPDKLSNPPLPFLHRNFTEYFREQVHSTLKWRTEQDLPRDSAKWKAFLANYTGPRRSK